MHECSKKASREPRTAVGSRSLGEVKRRGGWKQFKSVPRYEKESWLGFCAQQTPNHVDRARRRTRETSRGYVDPRAHSCASRGPWQGAVASVLCRKCKLWRGRPGSSGGACWFPCAVLGLTVWPQRRHPAVHTLRVARTFFCALFPCVTYRHRVHAWLKVFAVRMSNLSISPFPFSCFIRRPCCSRTVTSTPPSRLHLPCRTVPDPNACAERTSARAARSLATWPIPRTPLAMSPMSSTRSLLQMVTRRPQRSELR